ncbi:MAG: SusC/RagA family TonB-linked outer membrane protein, partial [Bacteroidota bacterium]
SSYNYVNTSLREPNLTEARFSSLYVEKADFFKLDNLTIGRTFSLPNSDFESIGISLNFRNPFVITSYTGTDPEPSLSDFGSVGNGDVLDTENPDVLSPGIDRRNNYFSSRSVTLGVNINF